MVNPYSKLNCSPQNGTASLYDLFIQHHFHTSPSGFPLLGTLLLPLRQFTDSTTGLNGVNPPMVMLMLSLTSCRIGFYSILFTFSFGTHSFFHIYSNLHSHLTTRAHTNLHSHFTTRVPKPHSITIWPCSLFILLFPSSFVLLFFSSFFLDLFCLTWNSRSLTS
jgi:hypothetical protein